MQHKCGVKEYNGMEQQCNRYDKDRTEPSDPLYANHKNFEITKYCYIEKLPCQSIFLEIGQLILF